MDDWVLDDRKLKLGSSEQGKSAVIYPNTVSEFPKYETQYGKESELVLITSDDLQYAAVYDKLGYYCEFFQQFPNTHIRDNGIELPYKKYKYLFTLKRDTYYQSAFLIAFVPMEDGTTRLVFNSEFNSLRVFELPSGAVLHDKVPIVSEFLGVVKPLTIPDAPSWRYKYAHGWCWGPFQMHSIIDCVAVANGKCTQIFPKLEEPSAKETVEGDEEEEEEDDHDPDDSRYHSKNGTVVHYKHGPLVFDHFQQKEGFQFIIYRHPASDDSKN
jgi:hypothetical protein